MYLCGSIEVFSIVDKSLRCRAMSDIESSCLCEIFSCHHIFIGISTTRCFYHIRSWSHRDGRSKCRHKRSDKRIYNACTQVQEMPERSSTLSQVSCPRNFCCEKRDFLWSLRSISPSHEITDNLSVVPDVLLYCLSYLVKTCIHFLLSRRYVHFWYWGFLEKSSNLSSPCRRDIELLDHS